MFLGKQSAVHRPHSLLIRRNLAPEEMPKLNMDAAQNTENDSGYATDVDDDGLWNPPSGGQVTPKAGFSFYGSGL